MHKSSSFFSCFCVGFLPQIAFESRAVLISSLDSKTVPKVTSCVTQEMCVVLTVSFFKKKDDEAKLSLLDVWH